MNFLIQNKKTQLFLLFVFETATLVERVLQDQNMFVGLFFSKWFECVADPAKN